MSKQAIWFKDGFNLKVDCIDDLRKDSGYLTMKVDINKVRMQNPHCILKVNINCKGCEKKVRKLLLKNREVDAVSIDAEQEKVTVIGKVDPNELIIQLQKSRKQAEICVQKGGENNGNGNGNGGKKNGNGNANANSGQNDGNGSGGKKNGNGNGNASGGENNGNGNANGGKKNGNGNGNGSENNGNGNASGGKKNGNGNGSENNGNGNASGGENNGNGNMAQMVRIGWGGYPYSNEQLHHMNMMTMMNQQQQQQQMNMYPQAMNYVPPPSIPFRCMADHPANIFNDENVNSCRIM